MDYDLTRLGTREFEHLAQALATQVLGTGVEVFGDGPDGGREAAFRGRLRYPEPAPEGPWDGYGILQAKFRARPLGTGPDTGWFLAEVARELKKWANPKSERSKRRELPNYLILATNVVLSPAAETGGIDTIKREIDALIKDHRLPIRGWRVWHYDQFCTLLDAHPEIRKPYDALITSGDVLAHLRKILEGSGFADIAERVATYTIMQFGADQWVRLSQAGEGDNKRLALSKVAIDLPVSLEVSTLGGYARTQRLGQLAVAYVLQQGNRILRPQTSESREPKHCAILGGPGQGKTTLSQLICQAYRVAFLSDSPSQLSMEQQDELQRMKDHLHQIGIEPPTHHRWPARIDLAAYSDAIAGGESISILKYLADQMNRSSPEVTANHLRTWLGKWPWILVLDGLDEVSSTSSRDAIIDKLDQFYTEARQLDADLYVVTTSRPQGYHQEFNPHDYTHLNLDPLSREEAVAYAERLSSVRFAGDPENAHRIFERLTAAASNELTARLMRSPLQVTIMSVLLERRERVPQERYRLFEAYYETIYSREVGKPGPTARLLDQHKITVDRIHQQVGLQLHVDAETGGDHNAVLPREKLLQLSTSILEEAGYDDPKESEELARKLVVAATTRLVLLGPNGDGVSFDVRSLQEFMAAQSIARDQAANIAEQLRTIAGSAHWRNTWLLAAGKIFYQQGLQRHHLISVLREIQAEDRLSLSIKPGSILALELLDDDVTAATPKFRRLLVQQALELLSTAPYARTIGSLAKVLAECIDADPGCRPIIEDAIQNALNSTHTPAVSALWVLKHWSGLTNTTGYRARKLLDSARHKASPELFAVGEKARFWPTEARRSTSEETNMILAEAIDLHTDLEDEDQWGETQWARDHDVLFEKASNGVLVATAVTGSGMDPAMAADNPAVRERMVEISTALPIERWVIASEIRGWLWSWAERVPCGETLLAVMAHDAGE